MMPIPITILRQLLWGSKGFVNQYGTLPSLVTFVMLRSGLDFPSQPPCGRLLLIRRPSAQLTALRVRALEASRYKSATGQCETCVMRF